MNEAEVRAEWHRLGSPLFVSNYVLDGTPELFSGDRGLYLQWRRSVANRLEVDPGNIFLVGSGSVGCSLNPHKAFRPFCTESDLDIAVISTFHFDVAWRALRIMHAASAKSKKQKDAIRLHKERLVFEGCIATERFLGLLPFGSDWLRAAIEFSSEEGIDGRDVRFRIYRDVQSLRRFHENGVERLLNG